MKTQIHSYGSFVQMKNGKKMHDEQVSFHSNGEKGLIMGKKNGIGYHMKIKDVDELFDKPASKKNLNTKLKHILKHTKKRKKTRRKKTRRKKTRRKARRRKKIFNFY
jgi:hypothetical protein